MAKFLVEYEYDDDHTFPVGDDWKKGSIVVDSDELFACQVARRQVERQHKHLNRFWAHKL